MRVLLSEGRDLRDFCEIASVSRAPKDVTERLLPNRDGLRPRCTIAYSIFQPGSGWERV
jgi:hypothetical protein